MTDETHVLQSPRTADGMREVERKGRERTNVVRALQKANAAALIPKFALQKYCRTLYIIYIEYDSTFVAKILTQNCYTRRDESKYGRENAH